MLVLGMDTSKDPALIITLPDGRRGTMKLIEVRGNKIKLGFEMPKDVIINRESVQAAIDVGTGAAR